jgi:hypothetical protein
MGAATLVPALVTLVVVVVLVVLTVRTVRADARRSRVLAAGWARALKRQYAKDDAAPAAAAASVADLSRGAA